jgi:hypothetical protein
MIIAIEDYWRVVGRLALNPSQGVNDIETFRPLPRLVYSSSIWPRKDVAMAIIHRMYETAAAARQAVAALGAAGLQSEQLSLITGSAERDAHGEPVGSFAAGDGHEHDAHGEPVGSFAGGDSHPERVGGFADVDRDMLTVFTGGEQRRSVVSHAQIVSRLVAAGLDKATAQEQLVAIHQGKALLLVEADPEDIAWAQLILATS